MNKYILYLSALMITGCSLNAAPKCIPGNEKCNNEQTLFPMYFILTPILPLEQDFQNKCPHLAHYITTTTMN